MDNYLVSTPSTSKVNVDQKLRQTVLALMPAPPRSSDEHRAFWVTTISGIIYEYPAKPMVPSPELEPGTH